MFIAVNSEITAQATTCAELISNTRRAAGRWTWAAIGSSSPKGIRTRTLASPIIGTSAKILAEGNRYGGGKPRLDNEEVSPPEQKRPQVRVRLAKKRIRPAGLGEHRASSAQDIAPNRLNSPPKIQRPISRPGVSIHWAAIDITMNMPEPIIEPTANMTASNRPSRRCSFGARTSFITSCSFELLRFPFRSMTEDASFVL